MFLLFSGTFVTSFDRGSIGAASSTMMKDLGLNAKDMGYVLSAFGWGYLAFMIPSGVMADRFGAKKTLGYAAIVWSFFSAITGSVSSLLQLIFCRTGVGLGESAVNPVNTKIVKSHFDSHMRGIAVGLYLSGFRLGLAAAPVVMVFLIQSYSWRDAFYMTGGASLLWVVLWKLTYHEAEKEVLVSAPARIPWMKLIRYRSMIGLVLCKFFQDYTYYFFVTWLPLYLIQDRHFSLKESGWSSSFPFLLAAVCQPLAGIGSDWLAKNGFSLTVARKTPVIVLQLLATIVVIAGYADSAVLAVWLLSLSLSFESGASAVLAATCAEIAPENGAASASAMMNGAGALAACICPLITGYTVNGTGHFEIALWLGAMMLVLGALSMWLIVGKIEPIRMDDAESSAA